MRICRQARGACALLLGALLFNCRATPTEVAVSAADLPIPERPYREGQRAWRVANGRLVTSADTLVVDMARTARVCKSLVLQLTTCGSGCIDPDTTVAVASGQLATVAPNQQHVTPPNGGGCSRQLMFEPRTMRVDFTSTESATLRFIGRTSDVLGPLVAVERRVLVR